jgi:glycosyltransferase involved in cell wall biosynthesis
MRIAQISPLIESVPPRQYGGTERIVSYLTEELVNQGHDVTLFASGDSETSARLIAPCEHALRHEGSLAPDIHHMVMFEMLAAKAMNFDIVHFHTGHIHYPLARRLPVPHITTQHGRLDILEFRAFYREYRDIPVVSISDAQRQPVPWINWQGTVYNGLPLDLYHLQPEPGSYLAFLGRISPEKGIDHAIAIARQSGMPLKIAAKVDAVDREYFDRHVQPHLKEPLVEFVGEINDREKQEFLGDAYALVFPIDWPEPFGLVMIEAMACGTPVISYRCGSVPEIMQDGETGFIVDNISNAVKAVARIQSLNRRHCRAIFEERFSAARMTSDYLKIYEKQLIAAEQPRMVI